MIGIYKLNEDSGTFDPCSDGDFSNPARFNVSPGGTSLTKKFFIRNSDSGKYYTGISLRPTTSIGAAIVGTGVKVKLLSGDKAPSETRWSSVAANGALSEFDPGEAAVLQSPLEGGAIDTRLPELGSSTEADTKYYPFWIKIEAAKGCPIGPLDLGLSLTCTEHLVDD